MITQLSNFLHIVWVVFRKDVRVWLRQPVNLAVIFIPALGFLLVSALGTAAVGFPFDVSSTCVEMLISTASRAAAR